MPHIDITMYPGRNAEIKAKLAKKVQDCVSEELGIPKEVVSVSVGDIEKENWEEHVKSFPEENMFIKP